MREAGKKDRVADWVSLAVTALAIGFVMFSWAWRVSHRGGHPLFSYETLRGLKTLIFFGVILLSIQLVRFIRDRRAGAGTGGKQ